MGRTDSIAPAVVAAPVPVTREQDHADRAAQVLLKLLLPLALLHGLLYLAVVPPWQHADEPTHFEYARLIALWNRQPALNEHDLATNREIADSMYRFRFWKPGVRPDLLGAQPPNIGFDEKVHPPLYYAIAAVPVRWLRFLSVETQLYAARMISVALYMLVIVCAWRIAAIVAPERPVTQLVVPLIVALVPAFADEMSAVNNDALVNFSTATLLLGCVLLIRDGPQPLPLGLAVLSLVVAVLAKRTALVSVPLFGLAVFWSLWHRPLRWWVWVAAIVTLSLIVGFATLQYSAAGWAIRPWLADLDRQYLRISLDRIVASVTDWERNRRVYPLLIDILFGTFWLRFGWGHVRMGWGWERMMLGVVLAGALGLVAAMVRTQRSLALWQRRSIWLFVVSVIITWCAALARSQFETSSFLSAGRYMHLAMLPTIWLLVFGFEGLVPRRWQAYAQFGLTVFFVLLDTTAWAYTLTTFYYR